MANNVVGEVQVLVVPDGSQFGPQLQQILNKATGQATQAGAQISNAMGQAAQGANQLGDTVQNNVGGAFASAALQAAGFAAAVYGVRAIVEGTVNKLAGLFDQLAQAQAGFASILKSATAGDALLSQIQEFARVSPFVTQELVNYSQQLLGVGVSAEKIVPLLEDVGNIVSSVGGDTQNIGRVLFTLTQIQSIGRLAGQDAMQLQSALIPITKYLSEYLGKTTAEVKKMQEQGAITSTMVFEAIAKQGEAVEGAMANATRNISGAKSVLQDTFTIMLQNQPVLQKVFEETYKGILAVATELGSPEFQTTFNRFFAGVDQVYEGLKPLVAEMVKITGSGIMNGMGALATAFKMIGDVLSAIPESVLEVLARVFAAMALLKAPLMLMRYVEQLGMLKGMLPSVAAATAQHTAANNANAASVRQQTAALREQNTVLAQDRGGMYRAGSFIGRNSGAIKMGGAIGAATVGSMLSESDNKYMQSAGGALQYGAMGLMVGGPIGGAVGAAVGAVISYTSAAEEKARAHLENMKLLGQEAANEFIATQKTLFTGATGSYTTVATNYEGRIATLTAQAGQAQRAIAAANDTSWVDDVGSFMADAVGEEYWGGNSDPEDKIGDTKAALAGINEELDKLKQEQELTFGPLREKFNGLLPLIAENKAALARFSDPTEMGKLDTSVRNLEQGFAEYGLTMDEVSKMTEEDLARVINTFDSMTTAQQQATYEAKAWLKAHNDNMAAAAQIFDDQESKISAQIESYNKLQGAISAAVTAGKDRGNVVAQLNAEKAALEASEAAYADALDQKLTKEQANIAAQNTYNNVLAVTSNTLLANRALEQATNEDRITELIRLAGVADTIDNRKIMVSVVTQGVDQAIAALAAYANAVQALQRGDYGAVGTSGRWGSVQSIKQQAERNERAIAGYMTGDDATLKALAEKGAAAIKANATSGGGGGGGGGGPSLMDKIQQASEGLKSAILSAMEAAEQAAQAWKAGIKEQVQYERAVSASRALTNAQRQSADISFLTSGIAKLKARGLSEEAIAALDINALTDVRQVKKLLAADPSQLAAISAAIARRDELASTLSSDREQAKTKQTITDAIVAAAQILGYDISAQQAQSISAQFTIVSSTDVDKVASAILKKLSGSKVKL